LIQTKSVVEATVLETATMVATVWHHSVKFNHSVSVISQTRLVLNGTRIKIRNLVKRFTPRCQWNINLPTRGTDVMEWHWGPPARKKCHIQYYQNEDRLPVDR